MNSFWVTRVIQCKSDTFGQVSRLLETNFVNSLNFHNSGNPLSKWAASLTFAWDIHFENDTFGLVSSLFVFSHQLLISKLLCYSIYLDEKYSIWISFEFANKNTLTGPENCKKTTRQHAHLSLCGKSRKTNDAKSRKYPKPSTWAIFARFRGQISPNSNFFWKIGFIQIEGHI